jgi:protein involved in polysaccharide export with SLBB domain
MPNLLCAILCLFTVSCASLNEEGATAEIEKYRYNPGDTVYISMRNTLGEFSLLVDDNGNVTLPYIGELNAAGKTHCELEGFILDAYVPDYFRLMTVD